MSTDRKVINTLNYSYNFTNVDAYIIHLPSHPKSMELASRARASCEKIQQEYHLWEGFDGTDQQKIYYPEHAVNQEIYKLLKVMNPYLKIGEVAAVLSHFSLWLRCAAIDKPIVILEHDAVMLNKYEHHPSENVINYLGNQEQLLSGRFSTFPPHAQATHNLRFILRAHAYAIDPMMARQLVSHVLRFGIVAPADMLIRADIFTIIQSGFFAADLPEGTTIEGRDENWQDDAKEIISTFI